MKYILLFVLSLIAFRLFFRLILPFIGFMYLNKKRGEQVKTKSWKDYFKKKSHVDIKKDTSSGSKKSTIPDDEGDYVDFKEVR